MNTSELELNLIQRVAMGDILRRRARDSASAEALVDFHNGNRRSVTYFEFNQQVNRLSHGLRQQGFEAGQRIAVFGTNRIEFMVTLFACYKAGIVVVPINFVQNPATIYYNLSHAEVNGIVYEDTLESIVVQSTTDSLPHLQWKIIIGSESDQADATYAKLAQGQPDHELNDCIIDDRDTAHIMYTSGTTSNPKGVEVSHLSLFISSLSTPIMVGMERHHALLNILPLFHTAALSIAFNCVQLGGRMVTLPGFDPQQVATILEQEAIQVTILLPMMWSALLQLPDINGRDFSSMSLAMYGMAPMDAATLVRLREVFNCPFHLGSGQTEFTPMACAYFDGSPTEHGAGNYWGVPNISTDQALIDDQGNEVAQGEIGEICWRGPQVMTGYLKNPEANAEARQFGWHHSGDLGLIDSKGQLLFVDRKKDTIKTGGENVSSMQVEQALLSHPAVIQAAAFGVPHPRWSEAVVACVVLSSDEDISEESFIAHCKQSLAGFETPKRVMVVDNLPMTGTSKVRKVELREQYDKLFA